MCFSLLFFIFCDGIEWMMVASVVHRGQKESVGPLSS